VLNVTQESIGLAEKKTCRDLIFPVIAMSSLAKLPQHGHLQNNKIMVDSLALK
jgi:hypothetical protein